MLLLLLLTAANAAAYRCRCCLPLLLLPMLLTAAVAAAAASTASRQKTEHLLLQPQQLADRKLNTWRLKYDEVNATNGQCIECSAVQPVHMGGDAEAVRLPNGAASHRLLSVCVCVAGFGLRRPCWI